MLKVMRDNLKKLAWVLWAVIAVFILLVFVDFGGAGGPGMTAGRDAAAWVGDEEISWNQFQRRHEALERQMREAYGDEYSTEVARQLQVPRRAIEDLVNDAILLEEARRIGIRVTDAELQETILSLPGFTDEQGRFIGAEAYERIARANRYGTPARLEEAIRQDLLRQKLLDVLRQTVHVSDAGIERAYR
ncbi:MAG: SurA N-terminal domain-containing protein, partial [Acidobacteriota bacterium]